ncbi:hypothetical protein CCP3SC1AL1_690011 [Gammaproteobacteria bacterium]
MIILLSGYAGSGKDTVADWICNKYPTFQKLSIASSLKEHTSKKYNFDINLCYTQEGKKTIIDSEANAGIGNGNATVRDLLIYEAIELKRLHGDDYFINKIVDVINAHANANAHYVISDVRYTNEIYRIENVYRLTTSITTMYVSNTNVTPSSDPSEHQLDTYEFSYYIDNNSSLDKLYSDLYNKFNFF